MNLNNVLRQTIRRLVPPRLQPPLKAAMRRLLRWWMITFFSFGPAELKTLLRQLGIVPGDAVIVHSSFEKFVGFRGTVTDAIKVLQDAVGPDGALLMPTLPFSASALEYVRTNPVMDLKRTPSRMGLMTEIFRRLPGVQRSVHPTHPVSGWGARAMPLLARHRFAETPCGVGSPFGELLEADGKVLLLGVGINAMTFFHFLEEDLEPRMPFSPFTRERFTSAVRDENNETVQVTTRLFDPIIGRQRDGELLTPHLKARGVWREGRVGRLTAIVLRCLEVRQVAADMASEGLFCYHNMPRPADVRALSEVPVQPQSAHVRARSASLASSAD